MEQSFMDYWSALDAALQDLYGIDTADMGIGTDEIAAHQEAGETPDEAARYYGRKFDFWTR